VSVELCALLVGIACGAAARTVAVVFRAKLVRRAGSECTQPGDLKSALRKTSPRARLFCCCRTWPKLKQGQHQKSELKSGDEL
jgi:hypothetical protein